MKALCKLTIITALCAFTLNGRAAVLWQSAEPGGYGSTGGNPVTSQWAGFGFNVASETTLSYAGAHVYGNGTAAIAIVPLDGPGDLPNGNPFGPGEVLAQATLTLEAAPSKMHYSELNYTLQPGYYGVVLLSGALGTSASQAVAPNSGTAVSADSFSHQAGSWSSAGYPGVRIEIGNGAIPSPVPEPVHMALVGIGLLGFGAHVIYRRRLSGCRSN